MSIAAAPPSVLLIDDDHVMLWTQNYVLTLAGFVCRTASSAEEGLSQLRQEQPDAVLCDLHMTGAERT